ncbi:lectin-like domain-containing protein [Companilactobacillus sp. HBUAS59699]|uniref:lectin-like domain-containing protein n=1 Tax=Companilactobacillus sp. HBUAS59699 TaxID=3109358 RepID=UPI002FF2A66C
MRLNKKYYIISFIFFIFYGLIACFNTTMAYADENDSYDKADFENAMKTAPRGLNIDDPAFKLGEFPDNKAEVFRRNSDPADYSGVLQVTNNINQIGAVWSNMEANNYIDLNIPQTLSMWLYFGRPFNPKEPLEVGDGMAFVLQNDPRTYKAISMYNGKPAVGETLGVWGADFNTSMSTTAEDIAKTAIQNSWALEFDTFVNRLSVLEHIDGKGVSFDMDRQGQHTGNNYPALPGTYNPGETKLDLHGNSVEDKYKKRYFTLNHGVGNQFQTMTDQRWHHITIKWDPDTSELKYWFNDKNLDGSQTNITGYNYTIPLDTKNFHFKDPNNRKLHWGFTGTTGRFTENNFIVFESIPSFINAESKASIQNLTTGKQVHTDNTVSIGDDLDFVYNLNYMSGTKDWEKILATMNLPSQVDFKSGTISYDDAEPEEIINKNELKDNQVEHVLKQSLNKDHRNAKIVLHTRVKKIPTTTTVSIQHASFKGDNFIIDDNTPQFKILLDTLMIDSDPSGTINYASQDAVPENTVINGTVWYGNGTFIKEGDLKVFSSLNDEKYVPNDVIRSNVYTSGSYELNIPKNKLHIGTNTLKIYAQDNIKGASDVATNTTKLLTINIVIGGGLRFGNVSDQVNFQPVNMGYPGQLVSRQKGWQVEVVDDRSRGKGWILSAKASDLVNEKTKQKLNGTIVYKNISGNILSLAEPTDIYKNTKDSDNPQTIDVADKWTNNLGIFLKLNNSNMGGKYQGKITWNLKDALPNN